MTIPDLTNDAYRRWLRAHRPPFQWFMEQTEQTQEGLASLGDEFTIGCMEDAVAQHQPVAGDQPTGDIVRDMILEEVRKAMPKQDDDPSMVKMAGALQRRADAERERREVIGQSRRLMGRMPDTSEESGT